MDEQSKIAAALNDLKPKGQVMTGFVSKHFGGGNFNENNYGLGYRTPEGWMAGAYRNSLDKPSVYVAREFLGNLFGDKLKAGGIVGAVTGYGRPIMPMAMPSLVYDGDSGSVAATMVPPIKGVTPATLALQYRKGF